MGTQKNRLDDIFFEHPKQMFKLMGKKKLQFNLQKMYLTGPMQLLQRH